MCLSRGECNGIGLIPAPISRLTYLHRYRYSAPVAWLLGLWTGIPVPFKTTPYSYIFGYFHCYFGIPCPTPGEDVSLETIPRGGGGGAHAQNPSRISIKP